MAGSAARSDIESQYAKACQAARLKFADGLLSIRTPDYQSFAANGQAMDLRGERSRYLNLFATALQVQETIDIKAFHQFDARHARCQTHDVLQVVYLGEDHTPVLWTVEGVAQDDWLKTSAGWRQKATHLNDQKYFTQPLPGYH
jgi:hypothetical protein